MNKEKILELAKDCGIDWFPQTEVTENQLEVFAAVIEHELLGDSKPVALDSACAPPDVRFEFTDKGKAEVVVCPMGLAYGVQCVGFPHVFAQFLFQSDAEQFVKIFNGTVARRVEPPEMESGDGFESRPVPPTSKEAGL